MMNININEYVLLDNIERMFFENDFYNENELNDLFKTDMYKDILLMIDTH